MKLVWKRRAVLDRENIMDFVAKDNPVAALELDRLFQQKAAQLTEFPNMGRPGRMKGTREWVSHPHYVIVCKTACNTFQISGVNSVQ